MRADDKTTATQLHRLLRQRGYNLSLWTVLHCQSVLGWTFHGSAYCQLIRDVNEQKWLAWARQYIADDFSNVIWTDKCSVQMEGHRRFYCRKRGEAPKPKLRLVYIMRIDMRLCMYINVRWLMVTIKAHCVHPIHLLLQA